MKRKSETGKLKLQTVALHAIPLEPAHSIKDRRSNTARAVLALESFYKFAFYKLFLPLTISARIVIADHWITGSISPPSPQKNCMETLENVVTPIQLHGNTGEGKRAMILLKHKILKSILLRCTRTGRASDLALPARIVSSLLMKPIINNFVATARYLWILKKKITVSHCTMKAMPNLTQFVWRSCMWLQLTTTHLKQFTSPALKNFRILHGVSHMVSVLYVKKGPLMHKCAHIFDLVTRLRQAVNHPYLVVYSPANSLRSESIANSDNGEQACGLCHDPVEDAVHGVQKAKTSVNGFRSSSILNRIQLDDFQTSSKIDALSDITCVLLDGFMTIPARDNVIKRFHEDPDCRIFLISLKAGGVALNLTMASHVFLMDPGWNLAAERQAMDRIHRIGQHKPIRIVRYVIENTMEERILKLLEKKELVFEGTIGGSSDALSKLTEADLKFLFVFRGIMQQICRQMFETLHAYHLRVLLLYITLNFRCNVCYVRVRTILTAKGFIGMDFSSKFPPVENVNGLKIEQK
ncbi:hypothetical protein Cgig2_022166 [Carnegiea gigantea]|uniref:Helicase C-terminal domain-containing protein n=1 Tax=Carnegiea gigantea TaxID=171969 RepID=A0A9Q1GR47_9CARY|nr:hypothetical protein Cgig2_022166 [Carnegiea gigantea]